MIYFDNAATTFPKPDCVYKALNEAMTEFGANPGRSGHKLAIKALEGILQAREEIAELFNIDNPLNISFHYNCTYAINTGIKGILKEKDRVVTTVMEHNSVLRPLFKLKERGLDLSVVKADEKGLVSTKDILNQVDENTALVVMTHVSNYVGTIEPIYEVAEALKGSKTLFMIDAAQSAGIFDIDVKRGIDLIAFPGHKGLFGPQGTGGLYVSPEVEIEDIIEGGTGSKSTLAVQPDIMPDKLESGTLNAPGIYALAQGVRFIKEVGIENIRKKEEKLTQAFLDGLRELDSVEVYGMKDAKKQGAVVSLNLKNVDSSMLSYILDNRFNIAVRPGVHCAPLAHEQLGTLSKGAVRFSFSYFNDENEVHAAIDALKTIEKEVKNEIH